MNRFHNLSPKALNPFILICSQDDATFDENGARTNRYDPNAPYRQLRKQQQQKQQQQQQQRERFPSNEGGFGGGFGGGFQAQRRRDPVFRPFAEEEEEVAVERVDPQPQRPRRPVFKRPEPRPEERVAEELKQVRTVLVAS